MSCITIQKFVKGHMTNYITILKNPSVNKGTNGQLNNATMSFI